MRIEIPTDLERLLRSEPVLARSYLVGGCVRDALLGLEVKDIDIEVFGVSYEDLAVALRRHGRVDLVGRSFGVAKVGLGQATYDLSVPRRDSKTGLGHRGFEVTLDPEITPREAAARRDFTINSLMWDPRTLELLDFHGGREDLEARVLRHTSPAFDEDPLRVLRGMQFASRFRLEIAPETLERCRAMAATANELPPERIREEWFKWAARSARPSAGIRFLEAAGWLQAFPEVAALRGVPQDPEWHPEGDVLDHTLHALDALVGLEAWRLAPETNRIVWSLAVLAHDFGKSTCTSTVERDGRPRIVSPGHEHASARLAESFLNRMLVPKAILDRVIPLVAQHMAHFHEPSDRAVRRLARRLAPETVENLCVVMTADACGRPPRPPGVPESVRSLRAAARRLEVADAAPRPLIQGRHLLDLGFSPGVEIGRWTHAAFEAQLDGAFDSVDGGREWLRRHPELPDFARQIDDGAAESPRSPGT